MPCSFEKYLYSISYDTNCKAANSLCNFVKFKFHRFEYLQQMQRMSGGIIKPNKSNIFKGTVGII